MLCWKKRRCYNEWFGDIEDETRKSIKKKKIQSEGHFKVRFTVEMMMDRRE